MSALTEKSLKELEIDCGEFRAMKQRLVEEKQAIQSQLVEVNAKLKNKILPQPIYHKAMAHRANLVQALMAKEREISLLNASRTEIETVRQVRKNEAIDIRRLIAVRDEWHDFSMDDKVDPVKRRMAWQFSQQLKDILKPYFSADNHQEEQP